jgi:hypothetical protein
VKAPIFYWNYGFFSSGLAGSLSGLAGSLGASAAPAGLSAGGVVVGGGVAVAGGGGGGVAVLGASSFLPHADSISAIRAAHMSERFILFSSSKNGGTGQYDVDQTRQF